MIRRFLSLSLVVALVLLRLSGNAAAADSPTVLSGGDLPHAVTLAAVDDEGFRQRINRPPRLDDAPSVSGASYTVSSGYWDTAVEKSKGDASIETAARYYPEGGFVRAVQDGEDVWLVIDVRQQAILNRYIRLAKSNLISDHPGVLEVLLAAAKTESIAVEIGNRDLTTQETAAFWQAASSLNVVQRAEPVQLSFDIPGSVWITFSLPEARSEQLLYIVADGEVFDHLGMTSYVVPFLWLKPVLGDNAPRPGQPIAVAGDGVTQEQGRGSPVWWVIMIGGGVASLAVASWWRRRWAT